MTAEVKAVPEGYHTVTPSLVAEHVGRLLDFVIEAFDAMELDRLTLADGTIAHAEVKIGDSRVMMGEASAEWSAMPGRVYLYVSDADASYKRALEAGATSIMEPKDQFYGDRNAVVRDPVGNVWTIATHKEDLTPEEIRRRAASLNAPS